MSLNDFSIGSSSRGYGQFDKFGQPQRQSYGGGQPRTHQHGSGGSTIKLPPVSLTDTPSPYPTNDNPLPPFSSFQITAAQPSYHSARASSTTSLRSPGSSNVPATHSHSVTTIQSQHYPISEPRVREASYPLNDTQRFQESGSRNYRLLAPSQRSTMKHRGKESTDSMQHFPAGVPTSMQSSPPSPGRLERDIGTSSSREATKEQSRRRHKANKGLIPRRSSRIASMLPQQSLQGYSKSNSHSTEAIAAESGMECRQPGCEEQINTNATFGACRLHHDQLSTWDFLYCEAEKRNFHHPAAHFPNGQCINKKDNPDSRWCDYHSKTNYHSRPVFLKSLDGKAGKWFVGRNEGIADLPPGYGTSMAQSSFDHRSSLDSDS